MRLLFPLLLIGAVALALWQLRGIPPSLPPRTTVPADATFDTRKSPAPARVAARTVPRVAIASETEPAVTAVVAAPARLPAFDSSEPLPPGVAYPEGAAQVDRRNADITLVEAAGLPATQPTPALFVAAAPRLIAEADAAESEFTVLSLTSDLAGWVVQDGKPEAWRVEQETLICDRGNGGWLRTAQSYSDFELRCDVRFAPGANTGVAFRFPETGSPTAAGIEVQLLDDAAEKYAALRPDQRSGSLYYLLAPTAFQPLAPNVWHEVRLLARGDLIRVSLGGAIVNEVDVSQLPAGDEPHALRRRPHQGYLGFQCSAQTVQFRNIRLRDLLRRDESGVGVLDLASGTGDVCPAGATVTVDYCGRLLDGRQFDSSYNRGEPVTVPLSGVIPGWQVGIPGMRVGGRRKLVVPSAMAYGDEGVKDLVPPGATLVFEVELRGVER